MSNFILRLLPVGLLWIAASAQGAMPAFRQTEISDQELKALSKWIEASKADAKELGQ